MLAAAGYPNGLTLKMLYRNASAGQQQDLPDRAAGPVQDRRQGRRRALAERRLLHEVPPGAHRRPARRLGPGRWPGWGSDWYGNAALSFFNPLFSGKPSFPPSGSNFGLYDNPATNALIEQANSAKTTDEAATMWAQADQQVMKDAPFFPITNPVQANYRATQVQNAVYVPVVPELRPGQRVAERRQAGWLSETRAADHVPPRGP